ncbi:Bacteriophage HK97-gp10, putative tail-component [Streptomyces sp. 2112.2]|uniref:HK97 gp10 family phage protein n=1 Tax=Streptomyces sp. 2112.2 TaxID=1881024 RepID=UPI000899FAF7|nr:HK97 gp10 family phage protein [Streptomyces sp. 2112.2]SED62586.1 Bacteriophage HK97-gp10, putative tail-component [Streptomyces sp. 2112.2]
MASQQNPHPNAHPLAGAYSNAPQIAARLNARAAAALPAVASVVQHYAMLLETAIKANASGRPGPNAPTGDYRRSWTHEFSTSGLNVEAIVGTNKPQSRRLEYGYVGADSIGRIYNQPPFPHVGPAVEQIRPAFLAAVGAAVGD